MADRCRDCGCDVGALHELFCTLERCPFCSTQLVSCRCIVTELALTPEEVEALDAYEDDTVDPLRSIVRRWERMLQRKGRILYGLPAVEAGA